MTKRDYANRTPKKATRAKPRNSSRGQAPAAPRRFPIIILGLVVLIALGGFGYFLWSISGSSDEVVTQPKPEAKVTKPKPKADDPKALPPAPKEEWTYLEELKNKEVEVDLPEVEKKPKRPYQMQCGSFRSEFQANEMKAVIAFQGIEAQVRKSTGKTGVWYRVVLGPYDRKRDAERHRHALQKTGMNGCQIWFWTTS